MRPTRRLFDALPPDDPTPGVTAGAQSMATRIAEVPVDPSPDERMLDLFSRVDDPDDPFRLRDLYLARVEHELGDARLRSDEAWTRSRRRRNVTAEEVLASRSTVRFVKEMFNSYFRDDLYGDLRRDDTIILSGGSVDEETWGLPATVKECVRFALDRDWYGYSDSRGRDPAREAVAAYESLRLPGDAYSADNIVLTMGGTFAVNSLSDFLLTGRDTAAPALCGIPNYPPLVEAVARRAPVVLVPTPCVGGRTSLLPLIEAVRPDTPLVLRQTAANPTGALVDEDELTRLIEVCGPRTTILLDECHEWLGPLQKVSQARTARHVVRISSLSKNWSAPGLKVGWLVASTDLVDDYYEYASTSYGGPPSFFYTAVEVLARMERWRLEGARHATAGHLAEFEASYGLDLPLLQRAFARYVAERIERETALVALRNTATASLQGSGLAVTAAAYSINLAAQHPRHHDGYVVFRDMLEATGVSVFPGLLTFCLSGGLVRVTTARRAADLETALARISAYESSHRLVTPRS